MNILYIHPAATFGGASKSLIETFNILKKYNIASYIITPTGSAAKAFSEAGMHTIETFGLTQFDNTKFGHYRNYRWLILLRELFFLPFSILALLNSKKLNIKFHIVHINEITLLPIGIVAKWIFKTPLVVHIRSVQRGEIQDLRTALIFKALRKYADSIVCIDETVKRSIPENTNCHIIHNGINITESSNNIAQEKRKNIINIAIIGVLLRMKGIYEFLEAAEILYSQRKLPVKFLIIGENARPTKGVKAWILKKLKFSENIESEVKRFIHDNNLNDAIEIKGFIPDVRNIYPHIDIVCFPSYLNAVGRPVFEAAFYGIPCVAAIKNPPRDAIQHNITGLVIEKPDSTLLANALEQLVIDDAYRKLLGNQARKWANMYFDIHDNALKLLDIYYSFKKQP